MYVYVCTVGVSEQEDTRGVDVVSRAHVRDDGCDVGHVVHRRTVEIAARIVRIPTSQYVHYPHPTYEWMHMFVSL